MPSSRARVQRLVADIRLHAGLRLLREARRTQSAARCVVHGDDDPVLHLELRNRTQQVLEKRHEADVTEERYDHPVLMASGDSVADQALHVVIQHNKTGAGAAAAFLAQGAFRLERLCPACQEHRQPLRRANDGAVDLRQLARHAGLHA
eukprot:scaffold2507_cov81-Phaeocystis_antarctica.AAC.1